MVGEPEAELKRPIFDPKLSIGWDSGPLDGMSCLLRCIEACLRAMGHDREEIIRMLGGPLNLVERDMARDFPGCTISWSEGGVGLGRVLDKPQIVVLDRSTLPWDDQYGGLSRYDHMMLLINADGSSLEFLDTDAPADVEFVRVVPRLSDIEARVARTAEVSGGSIPRTKFDSVLDNSLQTLTTDITTVRERLTAALGKPTVGVAPHVYLLGDLQPSVYLLGADASLVGRPDIATSCTVAAKNFRRAGECLAYRDRFPGNSVGLAARFVEAGLSRLGAMVESNGGRLVGPDRGRGQLFDARLARIEQECSSGTV